MAKSPGADLRRRLPSVEQVLQQPEMEALLAAHPRPVVLRHLRELLEGIRETAARGDEDGLGEALRSLAGTLALRLEASSRPSLVTVINATGVIVHTNLGRAPLSRHAAARVAEIAGAYSNLELDLVRGERGDREVHAESRLRDLLGVEATAVVNNCAAAVLLAANTLAEGREVLVSRGELVEIGGSFRIPDVLTKSGARLREVGTTNRTRISDFRNAFTPETALILKVHPSNFRIVGFTEEPALEELADLASAAGIPLVEDQGSGLLAPLPGPVRDEPDVRSCLVADAVLFSGDKLLGGPQAGLIAGKRRYVEAMRRNPLYRALRVDKMTLAALDAVLADHEAGRARERVPVVRMASLGPGDIEPRARGLARALAEQDPAFTVSVEPGESAVGGGAAPTVGLPTALVTLVHSERSADALAAALRTGAPPVLARIADGRLVLDLRTVEPEDDGRLREALVRAARALGAPPS
jgi:L-seryl-tRNA(Ser) seleniumtransferase